MALEALLMERKVLLLVYDDGKNHTTLKNVFKYYEHFRGIEKLNGFVFLKDKSRLKKQFCDIYINMSYFLFNDNREYKQHLFDAIDYIIKSK